MRGDADGVGDDDAEEDGPEDVLDVGEGDVVGLGVGVEEVLDELAGVADDEEKRDAGQEAEEGGAFGGIAAGSVGRVLGAEVGQIGWRRPWVLLDMRFGLSAVLPGDGLSRPKRMMRPRAAARRMAQASVERRKEERVLGVDMVESP